MRRPLYRWTRQSMIEAWTVEHRPWLYGIIRRVELSRWVFSRKNWHRTAPWWAPLRAWFLVLAGHETEICCLCGGKVGLVWWCPDDKLWAVLTGWTNGEGLSCARCFDALAQRNGIFLRWTVSGK